MALGASDIRFERAALADIAVDEPVDAVIGRLILMHLPDPVTTLRHLAGLVRPGGLIAFCEPDITLAGSVPVVPLVRAVKNGISDTFTGMGVDPLREAMIRATGSTSADRLNFLRAMQTRALDYTRADWRPPR
jgi:2-polyprenyl-3-methyl-5-hydroxy-6-metoxy-1,4-benzoquinol methylase